MDLATYINNFLAALEDSAPGMGIDYAELINKGDSGLSSLSSKSYNRDFTIVPFDSVKDKITAEEKDFFQIKTQIADKNIFITVFSLKEDSNIKGFMLFQSLISPEDKTIMVLKSYIKLLKLYQPPGKASTEDPDSKYKNELLKMRDMQAKLFPKFKDVKDLEIGSAFLPADLMSGNFIDAFYLDENTYQLVICEIVGDHTASIFAGTAIRALIRSETTKKMSPSGIIITITQKLKNIISGIQSQLFITIIQINTHSGKALISSLGPLSILFYTNIKKTCLDLKKTTIGRSFDNRISFKDISIMLQKDDILLYYSHIINNVTNPKGEVVYNDQRLAQNFLEEKGSPPVETVHTIISRLYEYTDYSPLKDDIILLCVRK